MRSINSVTNERRLSSLIESIGDTNFNGWLSLAHIHAAICISADLSKSKSQTKLVTFLPLGRFRAICEKDGGVLREPHPVSMPYLASPKTKQGRNELDTSMRRRAGVDSWGARKGFHVDN